jgi:acetyl-CoA acetyltransferase
MTRQTAITGVGYTPFTRDSGMSTLGLATLACQAALADAGLEPGDVDGIANFTVMGDSAPCVGVATALGVPEAKILLDVSLGGQAPCYLTWLMSNLVASGEIEVGIVYRAMNGRSGARVGGMEFAGDGGAYRYPIGFGAYASYVAMWGQRFLYETGQGEDDLWAVVEHESRQSTLNPRAARSVAVEHGQYLEAPFVVEPYRKWDCTFEVDGGCAVVITSLDRARALPNPPAVIRSGAYSAGRGSGIDIGDHLSWPDYTRNYTSLLADRLFGQAGVTRSDVDVAEIYDCFSTTVLMGLEGLGLCGRGESGAFMRELSGMAVNTHGGLLYEGYLHGMNTVAEAVLQIQGRAGAVQSDKHAVAVVTSGALMDGSAMVLSEDR